MFWEKCKISFFSEANIDYTKIEGQDSIYGQNYWIYLKRDNFDSVLNNTPIHKALSDYPMDVKEFMISGIAPTTDSVFSFKRTLIKNAFVTNAVSNSISFYAMAYLNNQGYSNSQIIAMKEKYQLDSKKSYFTIQELKSSFENQSIFFLKLYKEMNEDDRFKRFAKNLEANERFKKVFKNYVNSDKLLRHYERKVFHDKIECSFMRSDYDEESYHENTGVFSEKKVSIKPKYYIVNQNYLEELGMRLCKICLKN